MGRKRRFSAHAREKAVAEEVAEAVEMKQKEAVRGAKPNEELFIIDTSGEAVSSRIRLLLRGSPYAKALLSYPDWILFYSNYVALSRCMPIERPSIAHS